MEARAIRYLARRYEDAVVSAGDIVDEGPRDRIRALERLLVAAMREAAGSPLVLGSARGEAATGPDLSPDVYLRGSWEPPEQW